MGRTQAIGDAAETLAARYLQQQGLAIRERNYRTRLGELDLICEDGETLVFVEVRYRRRNHYGSGLDSVDRRKQDKLVKSALYYLQCHPRLASRPARFDVIAVAPGPDGPHIDWIRNAFAAHSG